MNKTGHRGSPNSDSPGVLGTARYLSEQLARMFRSHDVGDRESAVEACRIIDERQFRSLDSEDAKLAARAFVDALWAKDDIELSQMRDGQIDPAGIRETDYAPVVAKLRQRAAILGLDHDYATTKALAWRRHKAGGDYWTPFQRSQVYEIRAALGDPAYPDKPRAGQSGPGPEPMRYALAFELHDMHTERHWQQGVEVMVPYFARILREHNNESR